MGGAFQRSLRGGMHSMRNEDYRGGTTGAFGVGCRGTDGGREAGPAAAEVLRAEKLRIAFLSCADRTGLGRALDGDPGPISGRDGASAREEAARKHFASDGVAGAGRRNGGGGVVH